MLTDMMVWATNNSGRCVLKTEIAVVPQFPGDNDFVEWASRDSEVKLAIETAKQRGAVRIVLDFAIHT